jgi:hypothetical protein
MDSSYTVQGTPSLVFGGVKLSPVSNNIKTSEEWSVLHYKLPRLILNDISNTSSTF